MTASGVEVMVMATNTPGRPLGALMTGVSRMIGTEAYWADRDLEMARKGVRLVSRPLPRKRTKKSVWERVQTHHPLSARYYSVGLGGIEHLAGDPQEG